MSEQAAAAAPQTAPTAPTAVDMQAFSALLDLDDAPKVPAAPPAAAPVAQVSDSKASGAASAPSDKAPLDPLDPADFEDDKLASPEAIKAARERIQKAQRQALELTRAAHRAHGAAKGRETKLANREATVNQREGAIAAYDRAFQANLADLQSGDADKFLTAIHRLGNVGDPAGFWKHVSLKLASGGTFTEAEKKQAQADPEIQRRLSQLEQALQSEREQKERAQLSDLDQQIASAKARNLELATKNESTPRVVAYATDPRTAEYTREALAEIMQEYWTSNKKHLTVQQACAQLEQNLAVHFELSQRANGNTNRENGTTGSVPEAGRATSQRISAIPRARHIGR
jgi:hypothetical protein